MRSVHADSPGLLLFLPSQSRAMAVCRSQPTIIIITIVITFYWFGCTQIAAAGKSLTFYHSDTIIGSK